MMRYIGSKRRLGKHIMPFINRALGVFPHGKYIEPFVGGCNMITQVNHHTKIGYDANKYLIALLKEARNNPENVRQAQCISRNAFKYVKNNKDIFQYWYVGAMGFLATYSNKWMGSYFDDLDPGYFSGSNKSLLKQDLTQIELINADYRYLYVGKGNVIYCDPPYKIYDYYGMPFNHDEFYEWVRNASRDNIVFVSEYEMPADFACIWQKEVKPQINRKAGKRFEKLFIYCG